MPVRKPRLFSFGRETELANLDAWIEDVEQRTLLVRVIDAFIEISRTRKIRSETLEPIAQASAHPDESVRALAVTRLVVLAHYFEEAREAVCELATHPDDGVRLFIASSLANAPLDLLAQMLPALLTDASWRVRKTAVQVAASAGLNDALQDLLETESDARVRVVLELHRGSR